ncbi:protein NPGR1 [Punica granatum]|uniref:Protein NPGR1 n=3 Tax=Punica granatum TaxID=22663 RepID=A0A6P8D659_PUNGR|nr:protein NPGR1 [Punica granatum]
MLCSCSGEQFKFEEPPQSPESLATRDFSASGLSSRTGDWESKFDDTQVEEVESSLREALSLNYEEARALLGRLECQRGNYDAALQVFQGIDIQGLSSGMTRAIYERVRRRKPRNKAINNVPTSVMSMHSVSLLLEAILLKARSLEGLARYTEAAKECKMILDIVESALPNGLPEGGAEDCKLQEMLHKALELLPELWTRAGSLDEAIVAYRRALTKPWNLDPEKLASIQKKLGSNLLYGGGGIEMSHKAAGLRTTENNTEEAILLFLILMRKVALGQIKWDEEIMDHLSYALSITGQYELLAEHFELVLPGVYDRADRWYYLALCYASSGQNETAINLLKKVSGPSEAKRRPHLHSSLLGAKLCSEDPNHARDGINFARGLVSLGDSKMKHFLAQAHKLLGQCYGQAARISVSDSERVRYQKEALRSLNEAVLEGKEDPLIMYSLGLENAVQRNLDVAFDSMMVCSDMVEGNSGKCWKLISLILSAEKRFPDAREIVGFALDEVERIDQLELLRIKAFLEIAEEEPKLGIETYKMLLALIAAQKEITAISSDQVKHLNKMEVEAERKLEATAWQDLAAVYAKLDSWADAQICLDKAKSLDFNSPRNWHSSGLLYEARSLHKEALVSYCHALALEPDYVPSMVSTAEVLMKLGTYSLPIARSFLMSALRLEPTNHQAWWNLGLLSKKEGSLQQAVEFFQAAYELQSTAPVQSFV